LVNITPLPVCPREREREGGGERERGREGERGGGREREREGEGERETSSLLIRVCIGPTDGLDDLEKTNICCPFRVSKPLHCPALCFF